MTMLQPSTKVQNAPYRYVKPAGRTHRRLRQSGARLGSQAIPDPANPASDSLPELVRLNSQCADGLEQERVSALSDNTGRLERMAELRVILREPDPTALTVDPQSLPGEQGLPPELIARRRVTSRTRLQAPWLATRRSAEGEMAKLEAGVAVRDELARRRAASLIAAVSERAAVHLSALIDAHRDGRHLAEQLLPWQPDVPPWVTGGVLFAYSDMTTIASAIHPQGGN